MRQEKRKILSELKVVIETIKRHEPEIGEAVGQVLLANLAEGRVEKFLNSGTSQTVGEYGHRVCNYYKEHHDYIRELQAEEVDAWKELLIKLRKWAYAFIRKKGVPVQADRFQIAEDCANEAGARLANIRFPYDIHYDSWACRVDQNVCLNYIRRHTDKLEYVDLDLSETDEWLRAFSNPDRTTHSDNRIDLLAAIEQLGSEDRQHFIYLHYFEGKSFSEIADILGRTKNALYKLHFDALENLRKIYQEQRDKDEERTQ